MTKLPREGWEDLEARNAEAERLGGPAKPEAGPARSLYGVAMPPAPVYGAPPPRLEAQMPESAAMYGGPPPGLRGREPVVRRGPSPLGVVVIIAVGALLTALVVRACI